MRCCPKCGSVAVEVLMRARCRSCGHVGPERTFPHLHSQADRSRDRMPVEHLSGGYQRTPTRLDGGE